MQSSDGRHPAVRPSPGNVIENGSDADRTSTVRLWNALMSVRVLLAFAIIFLLLSTELTSRQTPLSWFAVGVAYATATLAQRIWLKPGSPQALDPTRWALTVGVDLVCLCLLLLQPIDAVQYGPLLVVPVLMASALGNREQAVVTTVLAIGILIGNTMLDASAELFVNLSGLTQMAAMGLGLGLLTWLVRSLSNRATRQQQIATQSRTEAQIQSLVNELVIDTLPDGVLVVDPTGAVHAANPAARTLLGSDEDVTAHGFHLAEQAAWRPLLDLAQRAFAHGVSAPTQMVMHHDDGHTSQLKVRVAQTPTMGEQNDQLCVMFLQDVRAIEEQVRNEKLASLGRMSAAVAHELRNPLAAISQANALLAEDLTSPTQQRLTTMVAKNAARLAHITEDVLNVAQVQRNPGGQHAIALDAEIREVCHDWQTQHAIQGQLTLDLRAEQTHVRFEPTHLRRLLINLLDNALRYASPADGAIQVVTRARVSGTVGLLVWSDGPLLHADVRDHMFEPFFSSESRSSGLGLFICTQLCEQHGATIRYERMNRNQKSANREGNGFLIQLRRAPRASAAVPTSDQVAT